MIEELYYKNPYLTEFTATVTECIPEKEQYKLVLSQTAFYPEGGGQPADKGTLNDNTVLNVQSKNNKVYHYLEKPLEVGSEVKGKIDFAYRFRNMQHHSGEHIVSGLICQKFGAENVGFHMGKDVVTMDFNHTITKEDLIEIEKEANRAVFQNLPIEITIYSHEEIKDLHYRSKKEIEGDIRIVKVPGYDICACCGVHVTRTGEIGLIKLLRADKYKTGTRISMLCGERALAHFNLLAENMNRVSVLLSIKDEEVAEAVEELYQENKALESQITRLQNELFTNEINAMPTEEMKIVFKDGLDSNALRNYCNKLKEKAEKAAIVFSKDNDGYRYVMMSRSINLQPIVKELNSAFQGKGGGKPDSVQGQLIGSEQEIQEFLKKAL
ncbi:MAG: hypothetical protein J6M02_06245 [Clostridia bacterium]|nr:hypothetical protein [Clostridia bacterium]